MNNLLFYIRTAILLFRTGSYILIRNDVIDETGNLKTFNHIEQSSKNIVKRENQKQIKQARDLIIEENFQKNLYQVLSRTPH